MTKLLYQAIGVSNQQSPFDEAILTVASLSAVTIVSPYISIGYLERIIRVSSGWRLISDVEAWLGSTAVDERLKVVSFIENHQEKIHHYPALHAKVLVSPTRAYLGSANITHSGILSKTELGLLLDDEVLLAELNQWVDSLWSYASIPDLNEVKSYNLVLENNSQQVNNLGLEKPPKLSTTIRRTQASLKFIGAPTPEPATSFENESSEKSIESGISEINAEPSVTHPVAVKSRLDVPKILNDIVDSMAYQGFTLDVLLKTFKAIDPSVATGEVYRALLPYCSNLARSVFARDTVNRLTYEEGWFRQSTPMRLERAQAAWDVFLAALIRALSFEDSKNAPDARLLESLSGIRISAQKHSFYCLMAIELIQEDDDGLLLLNIDFEWSTRFKLFKKAYAAWRKKLEAPTSRDIAGPATVAGGLSTFPSIPQPKVVFGPPAMPLAAVEISQISTENTDLGHSKAELRKLQRYAMVDRILNQILLMVKHKGNPFQMRTANFSAYLAAESSASKAVCSQIVKNEFRDFKCPLRIKFLAKNKIFVEFMSVDNDLLDLLPLTKQSIGLIIQGGSSDSAVAEPINAHTDYVESSDVLSSLDISGADRPLGVERTLSNASQTAKSNDTLSLADVLKRQADKDAKNYSHAQVDRIMHELLLLVISSGNPFHMRTAELLNYLELKASVPAMLCGKIVRNEFKGFSYPLRVNAAGKRKVRVSTVTIEPGELELFPLTKQVLMPVHGGEIRLPRIFSPSLEDSSTPLPASSNKLGFTRERADQVYRVVTQDIEKTQGILDITMMKYLSRRVAEKLGEDLNYVNFLLKGGIPACPLLFNVFSRGDKFHYILNQSRIGNYPETEKFVQALQRSLSRNNKQVGWLSGQVDANKYDEQAVEHERKIVTPVEIIFDQKEMERIKLIHQKADKLYAGILNLVVDFGSPLDLNKNYPTGEKVGTRLALLERNLSIIGRDIPANVPKLISVDYSEWGGSGARVKFLDKTANLKDYPLTYEALKKAYFLV